MKKIVYFVIFFMLITTFSFADITTSQGEQKVIQNLKQIYIQLNSAKENTTQIYNKIKTYLLDHPTQFTASDKTKLNNLETQLNAINNDILTFMTQVNSDFSGIND